MIDIRLGDAFDLMSAIEDNSIDLIFTDPLYEEPEHYEWLAREGLRVLHCNRALLAFGADAYLPAYLYHMGKHLLWAQMLHWQRYGHMAPGRSGITVITHCMWWEKGRSKPYHRIANWYGTPNRGPSARTHDWGKPESLIIKWMDAFSKPGDLILDPFCGSGVVPYVAKLLGRDCIAFEIDPSTWEDATKRVRETLPLPLLPEQRRLL